MSKSTVSALKGEISKLSSQAGAVSSCMTDVEKQLWSAMNDTVGQSAQESIRKIRTDFNYNMDKGAKALKDVADKISAGYDHLSSQANAALSLIHQAEDIKKGLGSI